MAKDFAVWLKRTPGVLHSLEIGKIYISKSGQLVGPMQSTGNGIEWRLRGNVHGTTQDWFYQLRRNEPGMDDGKFYSYPYSSWRPHANDLVAEAP